MTAKEFRVKRDLLDLSQDELAFAIGKSKRMIAYYESGEFLIPRHVEILIDHLIKQKEVNCSNG